MATTLQQIQTIRTQTLALIADLTANPKPDYSVEGRQVSWGSYLKQLQETLDWCDKQEARYDIPEVLSQGYT